MSNTTGNVIVAGSINMDIVASVRRHPVPGETISGFDLSYYPGGKGANQAVAASRAGARVIMVGAVGDDAFAPELLSFLEGNKIDTSKVDEKSGVSSGTALIVVDSAGENSIVVIPGANGRVTVDSIASAVRPQSGDVLVAQFETPIEATTEFFRDGKTAGAKCILNPAPAMAIPSDLLALVDVLVVNETELELVSAGSLGEKPVPDDVLAAYRRLNSSGFAGVLVATLGGRGAITVADHGVIETAGRSVNVVDTTGAGDCFVGYLASGLALNETLESALRRANIAASICVQRAGAGPSMPFSADLDEPF